MSTKSHIIFNDNIEVFEEKTEPRIVLGSHRGYDTYVILSWGFLIEFKIEDSFAIVTTNEFEIKISAKAIVEAISDSDGLMIRLEGGNYYTKKAIYSLKEKYK